VKFKHDPSNRRLTAVCTANGRNVKQKQNVVNSTVKPVLKFPKLTAKWLLKLYLVGIELYVLSTVSAILYIDTSQTGPNLVPNTCVWIRIKQAYINSRKSYYYKQ